MIAGAFFILQNANIFSAMSKINTPSQTAEKFSSPNLKNRIGQKILNSSPVPNTIYENDFFCCGARDIDMIYSESPISR